MINHIFEGYEPHLQRSHQLRTEWFFDFHNRRPKVLPLWRLLLPSFSRRRWSTRGGELEEVTPKSEVEKAGFTGWYGRKRRWLMMAAVIRHPLAWLHLEPQKHNMGYSNCSGPITRSRRNLPNDFHTCYPVLNLHPRALAFKLSTAFVSKSAPLSRTEVDSPESSRPSLRSSTPPSLLIRLRRGKYNLCLLHNVLRFLGLYQAHRLSLFISEEVVPHRQQASTPLVDNNKGAVIRRLYLGGNTARTGHAMLGGAAAPKKTQPPEDRAKGKKAPSSLPPPKVGDAPPAC